MCGGETFVSIGRIVRPHGIRGEVKVTPLTDWPERLKEYSSLYMEKGEGCGKWMEIEKGRVQGNQVVLKISGIDDRKGAESLRGAELKIQGDKITPPPEGSYRIFDLIGLEVTTTAGKRIGSVVDILRMPAQDVYVVDADGREVLIPAVKAFIKRVDIQGGEIVIRVIEGLLD